MLPKEKVMNQKITQTTVINETTITARYKKNNKIKTKNKAKTIFPKDRPIAFVINLRLFSLGQEVFDLFSISLYCCFIENLFH